MKSESISRLSEIFARARAAGRCALIPFVVAGDPDLATSRAILQALEAAGADAIELGIPYSDPLADGPSIVAAAQRALDVGVRLEDVLTLIDAVRIPVVLFTYANPIVQYGISQLAVQMRERGAAGIIIPDLPLEELQKVAGPFYEQGLDVPLLIAPTTAPERARRIATASSGFVYLVSRLGVTGAGQRPDATQVQRHVAELRTMTDLPIAVGFGLAERAQVAAIAPYADGAIVGSALVDAIARGTKATAPERARRFLEGLR